MIDTREWPAVNLVPLPGGGLFRGTYNRKTIPNPAAGAEINMVMPGGSWWMLLAFRFQFLTDSNVGQRAVSIRYGDGSTHFAFITVNQLYAANQSWGLSGLIGVTPAVQSTVGTDAVVYNLPALMLPPGFTIATSMAGKQVGDQYSAIECLFAEIDMGPRGEPIGLVNLPPQFATVQV